MTTTLGVLLAILGGQVAAAQSPTPWTIALGLREAPASRPVSMSADGRRIAFQAALPLVEADRNTADDVYLLDLDRQELILVSATPAGRAANGTSATPRVSADGRSVAFESIASDLVDGAPNHCPTVYRFDVASRRVSAIARTAGSNGIACARAPSLSGDGRSVAFESTADLLSRGESLPSIYVARPGGNLELVPMPPSEHPVVAAFSPSMSGDGRRVAYAASTCAGVARPEPRHVAASDTRSYSRCTTRAFVFDWTTTRTTRLPTLSSREATTHSPAISHDGRWVAYVAGGTSRPLGTRGGRRQQVCLVDLDTGTAVVVSRDRRGRSGNDHSAAPSVSGDGRFVVFDSLASNLLCGRRCRTADEDFNLVSDVFVWDRHSLAVSRLSQPVDGPHAWWPSIQATVAMDTPVVAFLSRQAAPATPEDVTFNLVVIQIRNIAPRAGLPVARNRARAYNATWRR